MRYIYFASMDPSIGKDKIPTFIDLTCSDVFHKNKVPY